MSARTIASLHPATWATIQAQGHYDDDESRGWRCGCLRAINPSHGDIYLCKYHEGFDDGAWDADPPWEEA